MLLKFVKLNYDLINFWCLQHHHHRPFNLICVPIFVPQQTLNWKFRTFRGEIFVIEIQFHSRHPTTLIDIKISWFLLSQTVRVSLLCLHGTAHTRASYYFVARNIICLDIYALWCASCNSMLIHFMLRTRIYSFINRTKQRWQEKIRGAT